MNIPKTAFILFLGMLTGASTAQTQQPGPVLNRAPLTAGKYMELPLGAVLPQGCRRQQLVVMSQGAMGHLDEFFAKLRDDNGWLGGKGDNCEETPYWLDGAVPLAHLLEDTRLKAKVQRYIDWTLNNQRPSGYFGPLTKAEHSDGKALDNNGAKDEDWWPRMLIIKVLQQHYQATGDARVLPFMTKYFQYQLKNLPTFPLVQWSEWSQARGGDNLAIACWLHNQPVTARDEVYKGPVSPTAEPITLIPYGCTTLRVVAFPVVN